MSAPAYGQRFRKICKVFPFVLQPVESAGKMSRRTARPTHHKQIRRSVAIRVTALTGRQRNT
jgi:hypothetical protein